jgi:hypothetical protein
VNKKQKSVLTLGFILIIITFLLPYTRYWEVTPTKSEGNITWANATTREGFRPIWMPTDPTPDRAAPDILGLGIRWSVVIEITLGIIACDAIVVFFLRK